MINIGSDNLFYVNGVQNGLTGAYYNNAVCTGVVTDLQGNVQAGSSSFTYSYISASNGDYQGTLTAAFTATLTLGQVYYLVTTILAGGVTLVVRDDYPAGYPV